MDTIVKFVIDIKMHNDELIEANKKLRRLLKQYIVGEDDIFGIWYKLNYDSVEYGEVKTFFDENVEKYGAYLGMYIEYDTKYSQDDIDAAVAFIPKYRCNQLEEYSDDDENFEELCSKCACSAVSKRLIAKPNGKGKKLQTEEALFKSGEGVDELYGVSVPAYQRLIESGFNQKNFREVVTARGKKLGYAFSSVQTVASCSPSYYFEKCPVCGRVYGFYDRGKKHIRRAYYTKGVPDFSYNCVLVTEEFYGGEQLVLISPQLYHQIKKLGNKKAFIPVYVADDKILEKNE